MIIDPSRVVKLC